MKSNLRKYQLSQSISSKDDAAIYNDGCVLFLKLPDADQAFSLIIVRLYTQTFKTIKEKSQMNIYAIFSHPENGRDFDQEEARKALTPGDKYPLQNAFVERCSTRILLKGITGYFNSVLFDFVDANGKPINIYEMPMFRAYG